jgi:hypothetical protein
MAKKKKGRGYRGSQPKYTIPEAGSRGPRLGAGGRTGRPSAQVIFGRAFSGLIAGLEGSGMSSPDAERYARLILSRPGVVIGPKYVRYKGKKFAPEAFAKTSLADLITGRTAERRNKAAIEGEPGYLTDLANLQLQRELSTGTIGDQRRRAILEFGDPRFAGADSLLGGEATANPYSTSRLLDLQHTRRLGEVRQAANRAGTLFGGGYQSGVSAENKAFGATQFDATRSLEDLLAGLDRQKAEGGRIFDVGQSTALQAATQRLLSTGALRAAKPPAIGPLGKHPFDIRMPWRPKGRRVVPY